MEFLLLLLVTLTIAVVVSLLVLLFFHKPVDKIFARIIGEEIAVAWHKFLTFALFVVDVSSGVSIWKLERFIQPEMKDAVLPELTPEYWGLEIYRTIIHTLGGKLMGILMLC